MIREFSFHTALPTPKSLPQSPTIVPVAMPWHKAVSGWAIFLLLASLGAPQPAAAQVSEEPALGVLDLTFFGAAAGM